MKIKVIKSHRGCWYKKGQIFTVLDLSKYQPHGVQVVRPNNGKEPDVVAEGDYEFVYE